MGARRAPRFRRQDGYLLWVGGPVPPGAAAITIGSLVSVRRGHEGSVRLLRHEAEHVAQYRRFGIVGFLRRYLRAYLGWRLRGYDHWGAYRRIPFEASAEWRARRALGMGVVEPDPGPDADPDHR